MNIRAANAIKPRTATFKTCVNCQQTLGIDQFAFTKSPFFGDQHLHICNTCVKNYLKEYNFDWQAMDKLCQFANIPFVPREYERLLELNGENVFPIYADVFKDSQFQGLDWSDYNEEFIRLRDAGEIENELPRISDEIKHKLQEKWGVNYELEDLQYLQRLYDGILTTQNVLGALSVDQAEKLCKISLDIDMKIRAGENIDKALASYDKLVKIAEFTPRNAKNAADFESTGELFRWLEKRGWVNQYYDGVTRDIVDETIKNIESYNQRLYTNESGIADEIARRIEQLKNAKELEDSVDSIYDIKYQYDKDDLDEYENEGYNEAMNEEFEVDLDGE